jgi:hypothetical protein
MGNVTIFLAGMMMGSVVLWLIIDLRYYIAPKKERGRK